MIFVICGFLLITGLFYWDSTVVELPTKIVIDLPYEEHEILATILDN